MLYFYRPQTKFAKVMFLHLSVSHSVHSWGGVLGASAPVHAGMHTPRDQSARARPRKEQCTLGDTGNKRAVRILLECILVIQKFHFNL